MATLEASVDRQIRIDAPRDDVWEIVSDESRLGELMPDVRTYEPTDDGWRWRLEGRRVAGLEVRPAFTVTYEFDPPRTLVFRHADRTGDATRAGGRLELGEVGDSTEARLTFSLTLEAPVPSMLRGRARAILAHEIERLAEGFLGNLRAAAER